MTEEFKVEVEIQVTMVVEEQSHLGARGEAANQVKRKLEELNIEDGFYVGTSLP